MMIRKNASSNESSLSFQINCNGINSRQRQKQRRDKTRGWLPDFGCSHAHSLSEAARLQTRPSAFPPVQEDIYRTGCPPTQLHNKHLNNEMNSHMAAACLDIILYWANVVLHTIETVGMPRSHVLCDLCDLLHCTSCRISATALE